MLAGEAGNISTKGLLKLLCVAFVVVFIWQAPQEHGRIVWAFLGDLGHFIVTLTQKTADFLGGLSS